MPALVAGIQVLAMRILGYENDQDVVGRDKPGHDGYDGVVVPEGKS
jgi:hypothetical protein